jgi:hypothetical protein
MSFLIRIHNFPVKNKIEGQILVIYMKELEMYTNFENLEGRYCLGDRGEDGTTILKMQLTETGCRLDSAGS